jgi:glucose-1-phosphate thymidylyltransferase
MKGILLAGGSGSRLFPLSKAISKQLLPVYDKPTIYYPLSVLMQAGIQEILIISTPHDLPLIEKLFGNGDQFGLKLSYKVQEKPAGIAQAFLIGKEFIGKESVCLILGDNIFYGHDIPQMTIEAAKLNQGAVVFGYHVHDPERYGVVEFDKNQKAISIEEKPKQPKSNWAVTGLYFYDNQVVQIAENLKPSGRGELEITDINKEYLRLGLLKVMCLGRGVAWLDTGTFESLLQSSLFVQTIQERQGLRIACLEEIALSQDFITKEKLREVVSSYPDSSYGKYVKDLVK